MINDNINLKPPRILDSILAETRSFGFSAYCEDKTGVLLRMLATTKPGGHILEIGTGTGVGACWILDGAHSSTTLTTIEIDEVASGVAQRNLKDYDNCRFLVQDANPFIDGLAEDFDLVFADTFPGKFSNRHKVLDHVKVGGLYVIDDLLPQANWPTDDHPIKVRELIKEMEADSRFTILKMNWASGLMVCSKTSN